MNLIILVSAAMMAVGIVLMFFTETRWNGQSIIGHLYLLGVVLSAIGAMLFVAAMAFKGLVYLTTGSLP